MYMCPLHMQENPPQKRFSVGYSSPFMRLAQHLTTLRAWCNQCHTYTHGMSTRPHPTPPPPAGFPFMGDTLNERNTLTWKLHLSGELPDPRDTVQKPIGRTVHIDKTQPPAADEGQDPARAWPSDSFSRSFLLTSRMPHHHHYHHHHGSSHITLVALPSYSSSSLYKRARLSFPSNAPCNLDYR